jgi:hypothetical protein
LQVSIHGGRARPILTRDIGRSAPVLGI